MLFSLSAIAEEDEAVLWVTRDFTQFCLIDKKISLTHQSAMQALKKNCDVETAYGDAFVVSINGIGSQKKANVKKNWFYYINGIMAHVGAGEYKLEPGDVVWWDFHRWNNAVYISAVIGAYPQPFLSGYAGRRKETFILHTASLAAKALELKDSLKISGVENIEAAHYNDDEAIMRRKQMLIIIGSWRDLSRRKAVQDIYRNYRKTGFFVKFEDSRLNVLDTNGKTQKSFSEAAAIIAAGGGFGGAHTVWFITGTDDYSVEQALDVLIRYPEKIKFFSGAVVTSKEVLNAPLSAKR